MKQGHKSLYEVAHIGSFNTRYRYIPKAHYVVDLYITLLKVKMN